MTQEHPITPPDELVRQWATTNGTAYKDLFALCQSVATQSARWGADRQLEACCEWVEAYAECGNVLRAACRPKPKSQVEEALDLLDRIEYNHMTKNLGNEKAWDIKELKSVRAALERLRELEKSND